LRRIWSISSPWKCFSSFRTSAQYASMASLVLSVFVDLIDDDC
jgi:hypothetical protein